MHFINLLTIDMCMKFFILSLNVQTEHYWKGERRFCVDGGCVWDEVGSPGVSRAACGGRAAHGRCIAPHWFMFLTCWHIVLLDHLPSFFVLMFCAFCWGKKNCQLYSLIKYSPPKQCCCSFFLTVVSVIDFMNTFAQVYSFCPTAKRQHADRKKLQKKKKLQMPWNLINWIFDAF